MAGIALLPAAAAPAPYSCTAVGPLLLWAPHCCGPQSHTAPPATAKRHPERRPAATLMVRQRCVPMGPGPQQW
jgi:hypothetical protein